MLNGGTLRNLKSSYPLIRAGCSSPLFGLFGLEGPSLPPPVLQGFCAGWRGREWSIGDFIHFTVKEGRLRVSGCGLSFTALTEGEGEYRVTLRLRTLADALRAFRIAGLVPGSIGFAPMRLLTLVLLRGGWLKAYIAPFIE